MSAATFPLALSADALGVYLAHTCDGRSMREIAAQIRCEPSTVMRRVRRVEDLRDNPEWNEILDALEVARLKADAPAGPVTGDDILTALDLTPADLGAYLGVALPALGCTGARIVTADAMDTAAVMGADRVLAKLPRAVALAALAFGWLRIEGNPGAKLRQLIPAQTLFDWLDPKPDDPAPMAPAPRRTIFGRSLPVDRAHNRNPDVVREGERAAAYRFAEIYAMRDAGCAAEFAAIRTRLPHRMVRALELTCGEGGGFEAMERELSLPARSGKAVVSLALETLVHTGVLA